MTTTVTTRKTTMTIMTTITTMIMIRMMMSERQPEPTGISYMRRKSASSRNACSQHQKASARAHLITCFQLLHWYFMCRLSAEQEQLTMQVVLQQCAIYVTTAT